MTLIKESFGEGSDIPKTRSKAPFDLESRGREKQYVAVSLHQTLQG